MIMGLQQMSSGHNGESKTVGRASDYTLYHGDCLEILPCIADGSVDAIIADPPYG